MIEPFAKLINTLNFSDKGLANQSPSYPLTSFLSLPGHTVRLGSALFHERLFLHLLNMLGMPSSIPSPKFYTFITLTQMSFLA